MRFVKEADARAAARRALAKRHYTESAEDLQHLKTDPLIRRYDIFLSHSIHDAEAFSGPSSYSRRRVRPSTSIGSTIPFSTARGSAPRPPVSCGCACGAAPAWSICTARVPGDSKWMPWELGYFDGHNGNVAIFPILKDRKSTFVAQEYLGIYPHRNRQSRPRRDGRGLARRSPREFIALSRWQSGDRTWTSSNPPRATRFDWQKEAGIPLISPVGEPGSPA